MFIPESTIGLALALFAAAVITAYHLGRRNGVLEGYDIFHQEVGEGENPPVTRSAHEIADEAAH